MEFLKKRIRQQWFPFNQLYGSPLNNPQILTATICFTLQPCCSLDFKKGVCKC